MKVRVNLVTMTDVVDFVRIATSIPETVYLTGHDVRVRANSLLGAAYTIEWEETWCECERDIYSKIEKYVV